MGTNVRVMFPDTGSIGPTKDRLAVYGLHLHNTRCDMQASRYHIAVQDLLLVVLHFGEGCTYNEALTHACNHALRFRELTLKKKA
jgi:hypothetical protein